MNDAVRSIPFTNSNEGAVTYDLMPPYSKYGIDFIYSNIFKHKHQVIADIGSGTGRLTSQILKNNEVYAVEPDSKMSTVAESKFNTFSNYHSITGFAEQTTLATSSIDYVTVGQSLHRFNIADFKKESTRILRNPNNVLILYNRIDYSKPIFQDLLKVLKKTYSSYQSRFEVEDEVIGSLIEKQKNCESVDLIYQGCHAYAYFPNEFAISESHFYKLCLSLWIFPLSNGEDSQKIIHSNDFNLTEFKHSIRKLYSLYNYNGMILLPLSTEVHFSYQP